MRLGVILGTVEHAVELTIEGNLVRGTIDGNAVEADAIQVSPGTYSILVGGQAFEVRVEPGTTGLRVYADGREYSAEVHDPRRWRPGGVSTLEAEGRQKVLAPMPGKIVRVLVNSGDRVETGQGLVVVEAMKMQNEVRSPKSGVVERLLVSEGQPVTAGETLGIIV
jgi:biotin carboxyl carrier protein